MLAFKNKTFIFKTLNFIFDIEVRLTFGLNIVYSRWLPLSITFLRISSIFRIGFNVVVVLFFLLFLLNTI